MKLNEFIFAEMLRCEEYMHKGHRPDTISINFGAALMCAQILKEQGNNSPITIEELDEYVGELNKDYDDLIKLSHN